MSACRARPPPAPKLQSTRSPRQPAVSACASNRRSLAHLCAPRLLDVFNLVVRPNPVLAPRHVYETKTQRWVERWPELTLLP
ncbi:MAG: nucleotidyltransferase family protein [Pseudonocardiaceae bacterium]